MAVNERDIKFVKNVNPPQKGTIAYGEFLLGSEFELHFEKGPDVSRLTVGDVVLLYQTSEKNSEKTFLFTFLVRVKDLTLHATGATAYPNSLTVQVVGKVPDGVERDVTSLVDVLKFRGLAVGGDLVDIDNAVNNSDMQGKITVDEVRKRIVTVFNREGVLEQ